MHAVELARSFGIRRVVVPQYSSAFSALGCLTAEMSYSRQQTLRMASTEWDGQRLGRIREAMKAQLAAPFEAAGQTSPVVSEVALVRYSGQSYAVEVFDPELEDPERLGTEFLARHEALYGFAKEEPWELVALRLALSAPREHRPEGNGTGKEEALGPTRETPCWFDAGGPVPTPRYERNSLGAGRRLTGPVIVEDEWSTVVLPPGAALEVDRAGHLHIDVGEAP
jgi:N-methylhydantoinase A